MTVKIILLAVNSLTLLFVTLALIDAIKTIKILKKMRNRYETNDSE